MTQTTQTIANPNEPGVHPEAAAVRDQLRRLLAHSLFTHSRRYPVLLAFIVEETLAGRSSMLKERAIGAEAFGREAEYDVGIDPIVRATAAEVRKRLIQYYYQPEHGRELIIELPLGGYVPAFRDMAVPAGQPRSTGENGGQPTMKPAGSTARSGLSFRSVSLLTAALLLAGCIGAGIAAYALRTRESNIDRFWQPVNDHSGRVTYCLGVPNSATDAEQLKPSNTPMWGGLDVSDVATLARSVVPLMRNGRDFRVIASNKASFTELREGPIVLIGAFDNAWTMRVTQDLPVTFIYDGKTRWVVDRRNAIKRSWQLERQPDGRLTRDFAIVARIRDRVTGQPVIIIAGILGPGTEAASELVSNPAYLNAMIEMAPPKWSELNLAAVIETQVIDGHPGPPKVLTVETW